MTAPVATAAMAGLPHGETPLGGSLSPLFDQAKFSIRRRFKSTF